MVNAIASTATRVQTDNSQVLLQITDWHSLGNAPTPAPLKTLRAAFPAESYQFSRLGLSVQPQEMAALAECCAYILDEGLSAYLYSTNPQFTVYLCEGEHVETWSHDAHALDVLAKSLVAGGAQTILRKDG